MRADFIESNCEESIRMKTQGERIRMCREIQGWSQQELGDRLNVQRQAINKWENASVPNIKQINISKMASLFDVSESWLMGYPDAEKERKTRLAGIAPGGRIILHDDSNDRYLMSDKDECVHGFGSSDGYNNKFYYDASKSSDHNHYTYRSNMLDDSECNQKQAPLSDFLSKLSTLSSEDVEFIDSYINSNVNRKATIRRLAAVLKEGDS